MKAAQMKGYGNSDEVIEINENVPAPNDPSAGVQNQ
jgi:hypothetical protein